MTDGLSIIIVILIIAIVLDGIRRARNTRRNKVKLSRNARKADKILADEKVSESFSESSVGEPRPVAPMNLTEPEPMQGSLNLDDPVPMLMESVNENPLAENTRPEEIPVIRREFDSDCVGEPDPNEPTIGALDNLDVSEPRVIVDRELSEPIDVKASMSSLTFSRKKAAEPEKSALDKKSGSDLPREILIINVMAVPGEFFDGAALLECLAEQQLKFGQRAIFHRHQDNNSDADVVYSVANIVEPGTFDFSQMASTHTPGICLFLSLPVTCDSAKAYDDMVRTAKAVAERFGGELKDENRSALTKQTIEHGRQRVMEFERKLTLSRH